MEYRYLFSNWSDQLLRKKKYNFKKVQRKESAELAANGSSENSVATCERNGEIRR